MNIEEAAGIVYGQDAIGQPIKLYKIFKEEFLGNEYLVRVDYSRHGEQVELGDICMNIGNGWVEIETNQIADDRFVETILEDL